jgi:protein-arginine kinase activator protein McsA
MEKCEVCQEHDAEYMIDLSTDEESEPVMWWACEECAQILQPLK